MVDDDATEEMDAAFLAGIALDGGRFVDDVEFIAVGSYRDGILGDHANDREESAFGLPAFRAATGVVVRDVAGKGDFDLPGGAMAVELAALEVGIAFRDAVVDGGVNRRHVGILIETKAL